MTTLAWVNQSQIAAGFRGTPWDLGQIDITLGTKHAIFQNLASVM